MPDGYEINSPSRVHLSPRKWNSLTWTLFILWLLFAISQNLPIRPDFPESTSHPGSTHPHYVSILIGWPFAYLEFYQHPPNPSWFQRFHITKGIINLLLIALVQYSVVAILQRWFFRFRIRTLFFFTALFAMIFALGRLVLAYDDFYMTIRYMYLVYFSPVVIWLVAMMWIKFRFVKSTNESTEAS